MTYRPGTVKRDMVIDLPRPRDTAGSEFNELKKTLAQMVMEEQMRFAQSEIRGVTAD